MDRKQEELTPPEKIEIVESGLSVMVSNLQKNLYGKDSLH